MFLDLRNNLKSSDSSLYECSISYSTLKTSIASRILTPTGGWSPQVPLNIAKINIAINLYEAGNDPLKVVAENKTKQGQLVNTDHLCGEHSCFRDGHAKLSSYKENVSRMRCHSGTQVCFHYVRCLNNKNAVLEDGKWRPLKSREEPTPALPRQIQIVDYN
jgi:hypothetical protein